MTFRLLLLLLLAAFAAAPATGGGALERGGGARTVRCAPRGELKPQPQQQYSPEQVNSIFQHIKQRLEDLSDQRGRNRPRSRARAKGGPRKLWDRDRPDGADATTRTTERPAGRRKNHKKRISLPRV